MQTNDWKQAQKTMSFEQLLELLPWHDHEELINGWYQRKYIINHLHSAE